MTGILLVLAMILIAAGAVVLYVFGAPDAVYRVDGGRLAGWIVAGGGFIVAVLAWRRRRAAAVVAALAVFIAFNWVLAVQALPGFEQYKPVVPLSREIERRAAPGDIVAHFDVALPSMVFYLKRHIDISFDAEAFAQQIRSDRRVYAVLPANRYEALESAFGVRTCVLARHPTADIRFRSVMRLEPPPELLLVTNRCGPT